MNCSPENRQLLQLLANLQRLGAKYRFYKASWGYLIDVEIFQMCDTLEDVKDPDNWYIERVAIPEKDQTDLVDTGEGCWLNPLSSGEVYCSVGYMLDLSEEKLSELELAEDKQRRQKIVESLTSKQLVEVVRAVYEARYGDDEWAQETGEQ